MFHIIFLLYIDIRWVETKVELFLIKINHSIIGAFYTDMLLLYKTSTQKYKNTIYMVIHLC